VKTAEYGRLLFGLSAVVCGIVGLMWHDSVLWQVAHMTPILLSTPVAWCLALAQVGGGLGIALPRSARSSAIALGVVYALFTLSSVPGMIAAPADPGSYVNFFEQLSLVCGAFAVFAVTAARLGLGVCTLSFAWAQVVYLQYTASLVPTWIPPSQVFWTILTTIAFALAAIAMLINVRAVLAMQLMALMMALFGILVWVPRIIAQSSNLSNWSEIAENYLMTGAALLVAAYLGGWRISSGPSSEVGQPE
jgi:hypothetical protein